MGENEFKDTKPERRAGEDRRHFARRVTDRWWFKVKQHFYAHLPLDIAIVLLVCVIVGCSGLFIYDLYAAHPLVPQTLLLRR